MACIGPRPSSAPYLTAANTAAGRPRNPAETKSVSAIAVSVFQVSAAQSLGPLAQLQYFQHTQLVAERLAGPYRVALNFRGGFIQMNALGGY